MSTAPHDSGPRRTAPRDPAPRTAAPRPTQPRELLAQLPALSIRDAERLRRRLQPRRGKHLSPGQLAEAAADVDRAAARQEARRGNVPPIKYPAELPVSQRREDLLAAIAEHQVIVVAGETGSGKTTQLPKMCLELGRGVRGMIGHTQPRRIAARSVAERLSEELGTPVGEAVGYAVRFTDRVSDNSLVKLMTDGILLAEIQRDPQLLSYDTIIVDEAHERSLNVDFLLGYLRTLLPRRPDLKLIITSATIDPQRFAEYFGGAPIIEVSGRGYPIDIVYRPIVDPDDPTADPDRDQVSAVCDAVLELRKPGDVLVFLSGEREIRDTADALAGLNLAETEIVPLYARLSAGEQHRIFASHRGRRIVLATNIAETSLTVPGIVYVIDAGTARISRYSHRTKVQLLPIEPISQASARQRAGRCGRVSPGVCIRLYSLKDFESRPEFTDPEILRTNLASVILRMAVLKLGSIADFGFLEPPDRRQITDGLALLTELGAITDAEAVTLTETGRRIAELPIDPRLARMIVEADQRGCVRDVLVLAAALSIQDPRERPLEHQQAADAAHARFADPTSDFAGLLNLWRHIREQQRELSASAFRRSCRTEYLNYLRIREWQDLFTQLRSIVKGMGITIGDASEGQPDLAQIHRSLLSGLLSHIGLKDESRGQYAGARGVRFAIFPGSALAKKPPPFVIAAELVETSRLWGRVTAGVDPEWAEELAPHLVKRSYSEPRWQRRRGAAVALERVTLYGVPIVVGRTVGYHRIDPELSRELFIRHGLIEQDWDTRHRFFAANAAVIAEIRDREERARRRDILIDDETLFAFYDSRIPSDVVSARHFDSWWSKARHATPDLLTVTADQLVRPNSPDVSEAAFPSSWTSGEFALELAYRFEPGKVSDGVTVSIPLALLPDAAEAGLDWQVPGLRHELVTALMRGLPKPLRRQLVPVPDTATALMAVLPGKLADLAGELTAVLSEHLRVLRDVVIPPEAWDLTAVPDHLRPNYQIVDAAGRELAVGKNLGQLKKQFAPRVAATLSEAAIGVARDDVTSWDFDELPRVVQVPSGAHQLRGYPALVATDSRVDIRVLDSSAAQQAAMWAGTRRLLVRTVPGQQKALRQSITTQQRLSLSRAPHGSLEALLADCIDAAIDAVLRQAGGPVWTRTEFDALATRVKAELPGASASTLRSTIEAIDAAQQVELQLTGCKHPAVRAEVAAQLKELVYPGFVTAAGAQVSELPRYLAAMALRLIDAATNLARDRERQAQIDVVCRDLADLSQRRPEADIGPIRWMISELRVSVFAQRLGTPRAVSVPRIHTAMDALDPR